MICGAIGEHRDPGRRSFITSRMCSQRHGLLEGVAGGNAVKLGSQLNALVTKL